MPDRQSANVTKPRVLLALHEVSRTGAPVLARDIFGALGDSILLRSVAWTGGPLEADFRRLGPLTVLSTYPRVLPKPGGASEAVLAAKAVGRARLPLEGLRLRRWRPDVVYANTVWSLPLVARLGLAGQPIVLHVHELSVALSEFEAAHPGLIEGLPSRYIAVSEAVAAALHAEYDVRQSAIAVIRPFVGVPQETKAMERSHDGPFVVGGMGNPSWTKGGVLWLLAARDVVDQLGEGSVRFRWVGLRDNEHGRQFRSMVYKLGLTSSVDLVAETQTPLAELVAFDLLAMTSWEEAAPLVILEAMSLGVPVLAFRGAGGPDEQLTPGGLLVDGFMPKAMAKAIVDLHRDGARRLRVGAEGKRRAEALNKSDQTANLVTQVIQGLRDQRAEPDP